MQAGVEVKIAIDELVPDPHNAMKHGARNIEAVRKSLTKWGQRTRLVVNRRGMVVLKGNGTLEAAKLLGWTELDCLLVDDAPKSGRAYAIADNRSSELAEWDPVILHEGLLDIGPLIVDASYTLPEVDALVASALGGGEGDEHPLPQVPTLSVAFERVEDRDAAKAVLKRLAAAGVNPGTSIKLALEVFEHDGAPGAKRRRRPKAA